MTKKPTRAEEIVAIDRLDRLIHEPARLKIMTQLYIVESGDFTYLMRSTGLTRGNLSSHMTRLEEAEYIEVVKEFVDRKPMTILRLTEIGRQAFLEYRENIAQAIEAARDA